MITSSLYTAGVSFFGGAFAACLRVSGSDQSSVLEEICSDKDLEGLGIVRKKPVRRMVDNVLSYTVSPLIVAGMYSVFIGSESMSYAQNAAIIFPLTFVGYLVPNSLLRFFNKKRTRDILGKVEAEPENGLDFLPKKTSILVKKYARRIEDLFSLEGSEASVDGRIESLMQDLAKEKDMKSTDGSPLQRYIIGKSLTKITRTGRIAKRTMEIFGDKLASFSAKSCGNPENTRIDVYDFDGRKLRVHKLRFDDLSYRSANGKVEFESGLPDMETVDEVVWDGDYMKLAKRIYESSDGESHIFLSKTSGVSTTQQRKKLYAELFSDSFIRAQSRRE